VDLSSWRDVMLIIWASVATIAIVFISVILFLFYRKTISVLDSTDMMVNKASDIVEYLNTEVIRPVSRFGTMAQGIIQGINIFTSIFKKKENQDE
jgi:Na+/proline symporter